MPIEGERSGQAMLIAILALGGAMIAATAIAGFLILYQIRSSTDSLNSAKAIFAADAGADFGLFNYYCATTSTQNPIPRCTSAPVMGPFSGSGATVTVTCYDANNSTTACYNNSSVTYIVSRGTSESSSRAFYEQILSTSTIFP